MLLKFDLILSDPNRDGPINADHLRKIESIVNEQIISELDVYSKEATLAEAKRINGLRAVFGEVSLSIFLHFGFLIWLCTSILEVMLCYAFNAGLSRSS